MKKIIVLIFTMMVSLAGCGTQDEEKIVYWSMWSEEEPQAKVIKEAAARYTEDTGIAVDVQFKGRNGQREGLQPALESKQTIDIFDEDVNRVNGSWGKYLMELEELAKDFEAEHGNATLYEIAREAAGGTLKSIPYQPSIFGCFYNKTLFEKAGIKSVPTTWDELEAVCEKLKAAGITPITGDTAYSTSYVGYHLGRYLGQEGVKALVNDPTLADASVVNWDDPRVLQAAKDLEEFAAKGYFSEHIAANIYPSGQNQEFAAGEAAIIICGSWLPNEIKETVSSDFEWGYFNYPAVAGGIDGTEANNISTQVLAIHKDSKMAKEAFEFITYIASGTTDQQMVETALCIPADSMNTEWPAELAEVKEAFAATKIFYDWAVGVENNGDLTSTLSQAASELMAGKLTAEEFVSVCKKVCD